jgi:hypothetical protein
LPRHSPSRSLELFGASVPAGGEDTVFGFSTVVAPPAARTPTVTPIVGAALAASRVPVMIRWGAASVGTGVASYVFETSKDGGVRWSSPVSFPGGTVSLDRRLAVGSTRYRFRVFVTDTSGVNSIWSTGPAVTMSLVQDSTPAIRYSGSWSRKASASASGRAIHMTTKNGAAASFAFTARGICYVAERRRDGGKARIYVENRLVATIDLRAAATQSQRIVYAKLWARSGRHTVRIENLATGGRPAIDVDAFVLMR